MRTQRIFTCCAAFVLFALTGCRNQDDQPTRQADISKRCDVVVVSGDDVMAGVNVVDHTYIGPEIADEYDPNARYSAEIDIFSSQGDFQGRLSLPGAGTSAIKHIYGLRALPGHGLLVIGTGEGWSTAVLDSNGAVIHSRQYEMFLPSSGIQCKAAGDVMMCLYAVSGFAGTRNNLAVFDDEGELVSAVSLPDTVFYGYEAAMTGLNTGDLILNRDAFVDEVTPQGDIAWTATVDAGYFTSAGVSPAGELFFFGTGDFPTPSQNLVVGRRVGDSVEARIVPTHETISSVRAAVPGPAASWYLVCEAEHAGQNGGEILRFDGADSVSVMDAWAEDGHVEPICAASSDDGGFVIGGRVNRGTVYNDDYSGFLRAYSSAGTTVWMNKF